MVMEYCAGGSLDKFLAQIPNRATANIFDGWKISHVWGPAVNRWLKQFASGMSYLHGFQHPIIHRDLKPSNLFMTDLDPKHANLKVITRLDILTHMNHNEE